MMKTLVLNGVLACGLAMLVLASSACVAENGEESPQADEAPAPVESWFGRRARAAGSRPSHSVARAAGHASRRLAHHGVLSAADGNRRRGGSLWSTASPDDDTFT